MSQDRSREALLNFLTWLGEKGYVPANTATARKIVATKVLAELSGEEAADVTKLDIETTMARFENRNRGKYGQDSLRTYQSRLRNSIRDFTQYANDPLAYQPKKSAVLPARTKPKALKSVNSETSATRIDAPIAPVKTPNVDANVLPIALREDLIVRIFGLPFDLSPAEGKKIANIVLAHVSE